MLPRTGFGRLAIWLCVAALLAIFRIAAQQPSFSVAAGADNAPGGACLRPSIPLTLLAKSQNVNWEWTDFRVAVGGKATAVAAFREARPPRIILLVDTSGSMSAEEDAGPPWQGPQHLGVGLLAAMFAAETIPQDSVAAFGTFNDTGKISIFLSHTQLKSEVLALGAIPPKGRTALYLAIRKVIPQFEKPQFGDTIYLVTDGGDNLSGELREKVKRELIARGIRVFVFFVLHQFRSPEEREGARDMAELARSTGGGLVEAPWSKNWLLSPKATDLAAEIADQVRWPYRLELQLDRPLEKPAKVKITLPPANKSLSISYPKELEPCVD